MSEPTKSKWFNPYKKMFRVREYHGAIEEVLVERETPKYWVLHESGESKWTNKVHYPLFETRAEAEDCYLDYLRKERARLDGRLHAVDERIRRLRDPDRPAPALTQKRCLEFIYGEMPPPPGPSEFERLCAS